MKNTIFAALLLAISLVYFNCDTATGQQPATPAETAVETEETVLKRGEYLLAILDCDACHTPKMMTPQGPVPDMSKRLSGYQAGRPLPAIDKSEITPDKWVLFTGDLLASVGPWGVSYGANLTPHETGTGNWTFENFKTALTQGKHKGMENGRPLLPPMPWQAYRNLSEDDMKALFKAIQNLPAIENIVPAPIPPTEI